jgi:hypothetical protein
MILRAKVVPLNSDARLKSIRAPIEQYRCLVVREEFLSDFGGDTTFLD